MSTKQLIISSLLMVFIISACKEPEKKTTEIKTTTTQVELKKVDPCDSPKTVKDLLGCANSVGSVKLDSVQIKLGADLNEGCGTAWNPKDTVLIISYKDSVSLWRVNQKKNTPGNYMGHWFTNFSAKDAGYTKSETLNKFALNPCPDNNASWSTCVCPTGKQPVDSVIQYEEHVKLGPNQKLQFGVVGKSPFGQGGEMQWHMTSKRKPPYRLLEQIRWK